MTTNWLFPIIFFLFLAVLAHVITCISFIFVWSLLLFRLVPTACRCLHCCCRVFPIGAALWPSVPLRESQHLRSRTRWRTSTLTAPLI